jgi:hypothetical protein
MGLDLSAFVRESADVRVVIALVVVLGLAAHALAAEQGPPAPEHRAAATVAAIVPGVVLHGTGHFVAGDRGTGWRLLAMEGAGLGLTAAGFGTLVATGASRHLSAPIFALPVAGVGLVLLSWLADVQGVAMPAGWRGTPALETPLLEARLGTRYVYDPTLKYGTLIGPGADLRWGRLRLSPGAWIATSGGNLRLELEGAWRAVGARPSWPAADGSSVDVVAGLVHHRFPHESFELTVLEAGARGRFDLRRLAASLQGSFAEWGLGLGWALTHYRVGAHETDADGLLLARFGYGLYLGHAAEVLLYYDHRHDDYAGGAKLTGLGSGAAGHAGLAAAWFFLPRWGVRLEAQAGAAYLGGLSLVHRSSPGGGS